jgi:putative DNA primase/helicase
VAEGAGILAWAVAGSAKWYKSGFGTPPEVTKAGKTWREDSDQIRRFIAECCFTVGSAKAQSQPLYTRYRNWMEEARERPMSLTDFGNSLIERGFERKHTDAGSIFMGIGLKEKEGETRF